MVDDVTRLGKTQTIGDLLITHDDSGKIYSVLFKNEDLKRVVESSLDNAKMEFMPLRPYRSRIEFPECLLALSRKVFETIDKVRIKYKDECLAAYLASYYYEGFTIQWNRFLEKMQHTLAACFWLRLLEDIRDWESNHPNSRIHKGTPYYFLAVTFLFCGDTDSGFTYLYSAINEAKRLGPLCPALGYPEKAPSYLTTSLIDNRENYMYFFVKEFLDLLSEHIVDYNKLFNRRFSVEALSAEFLKNPILEYPRYFFVYNLWVLSKIRETTERDSLVDNDFSMLRNLDTIFNLCLIVDKVLERKYGMKYISGNVIKICEGEGWMKQNELEVFQGNIGVPKEDPDIVIPRLLQSNVMHEGKPVCREVLQLLVAWKLRNYGGHNLEKQKVLTERFEEIVRILMNCLFMTIEARQAWRKLPSVP